MEIFRSVLATRTMANNLIPRKDPMLNEALDILEMHFKRSRYDYAEAFATLTKDENEFINDELTRCATDSRYYLENYHIVKTEDQGFRTLYPMWDSQELFLQEIRELIGTNRPVKVLVLKARQLGLSTISEGLIFHRTIFYETINSLIVAQDPGQADYLFSMFTRAYDNLPWWMKPEVKFRSKGRYMTFDSLDVNRAGLNSEIFVEAANKVTGVSVGKTIRAAHLSELSAWPNAKILTEQIFPTMNARDELAILESTARGRQGFWYDFWRKSVQRWGDGSWEWKPIFIEWFRCRDKYSRPIEDKTKFVVKEDERALRAKSLKEVNFFIPDEMFQWRRMKLEETIGIGGDEWGFYQEYPSNWMEAFQASGLCAFPKRTLQRMLETTCCNPRYVGEIEYKHEGTPPYRLHSAENPGTLWQLKPKDDVPGTDQMGYRLRVWEMPEEGELYYVAADPAGGIEGGDYSCIQVFKIGSGPAPDEQVAEWHGWINPTPFGNLCCAIGYMYNEAELSLELNSGFGEKAYMEIFRILQYPKLFRWKHYDKIKNFYTDYMGWFTNVKTRELLITGMRERIMERTVILRSPWLLDEMMDFSQDESGTGRFEGQNTNDDRVFAAMIAVWCAHDSDYGKAAAARTNVGLGKPSYYVFDGQGKLVKECEVRDEAWALASSNSGWSFRRQLMPRDFANSDYSPVFDKEGPRRRMYDSGVPSEDISVSGLMDSGGEPEKDWRNV